MCNMRVEVSYFCRPKQEVVFISVFQMRTLRNIMALIFKFKCIKCEKGNYDRDGMKIHLKEDHEKGKVS